MEKKEKVTLKEPETEREKIDNLLEDIVVKAIAERCKEMVRDPHIQRVPFSDGESEWETVGSQGSYDIRLTEVTAGADKGNFLIEFSVPSETLIRHPLRGHQPLHGPQIRQRIVIKLDGTREQQFFKWETKGWLLVDAEEAESLVKTHSSLDRDSLIALLQALERAKPPEDEGPTF